MMNIDSEEVLGVLVRIAAATERLVVAVTETHHALEALQATSTAMAGSLDSLVILALGAPRAQGGMHGHP